MATYHCSVQIISRSAGRSSVAAAAYRAGERIENERDGLVHDFTRKRGVEYAEIYLPEGAPARYADRAVLWNAVELAERRRDAQTAREIELALPAEFDRYTQRNLVEDYVLQNFVDRGMVADVAIHDKGDGNPHAHIMLTMRAIDEQGKWKGKQKKEYILDENGQKQYDPKKQVYKCRTIKTTDWDAPERLIEWRAAWAEACNQEYGRLGFDQRIDHRSYADQGIAREPGVHLGAAAWMEQRGIRTERGDINREAEGMNMEHRKDLDELDAELQEIRMTVQRHQQEPPTHTEQEAEPHPHGTLHDEAATRSWQRATTLQREDTYSAAYEALSGAEDKHSFPASAEAAPEPEPPQHSAEQLAGELSELKREHARLELEIGERQREGGALRGQAQQLRRDGRAISEEAQRVREYDTRIEAAQEKRGQLGAFARKGKRAIDENVKQWEQTRGHFAENMRRDYGVGPEDAPGKIQELERRADTLERQAGQLPPTDALKERQQEIMEQYKRAAAEARQYPEMDTLLAAREQVKRQGPGAFGGKRLAEILAEAKSRADLHNAARESTRPTTDGPERSGPTRGAGRER